MNVVIIGAGGHGKVILDILRQDADTKVVGFIDDSPDLHGRIIDGAPVLGGTSALAQLIKKHRIEGAIIALGHRRNRAALFEKAKASGLQPINAVHPSAIIAGTVRMGVGVMVAAGAIINTDAVIGDDVIVNTGCSIDHDNVIGDHVNIQPGVHLGGVVKVKPFTELGIGATVIHNITIGEGVDVAAGAVLISDVPDKVTVAGVPAKVIKTNKPE